MARYTDDDVQKLTKTLSSRFPLISVMLQDELKPFKPDPWEELGALLWKYHHIGDIPDSSRDSYRNQAEYLVRHAVELGLVKRVDGDD